MTPHRVVDMADLPLPHICPPCVLGQHSDHQHGVWRKADGSDPVYCVCTSCTDSYRLDDDRIMRP